MKTVPTRAARILLLTTAGAIQVLPISAHHSFAMFDTQHMKTTDAEVQSFIWQNPHTWLDVLVTQKDGTKAPLSLEMVNPAELMRCGWKPHTLKPGDMVNISYHPMKNGTPAGQLEALTITAMHRQMQISPNQPLNGTSAQ